MRKYTLLLVGFLAGAAFALAAPIGHAVETKSNINSAGQNNIVYALKLSSRGHWSDARRQVPRGGDTVEQKLFEWVQYRNGAPGVSFDDIAAFVNANPDWPLLDRLRLQAEKIMPNNLSDQQTIGWFQNNQPVTPGAMERYVQALINSGNKTQARQVIREWWPTANLTRDQQKGFYARYESYYDTQTNRARFNALISRGEYSNARGMASVLGPGYSELAEARIALSSEAGNPNASLDRVPAKLQNDEGLLYERLRWRRRHDMDEGAIEILANSPSYGEMFDPSAWWQERHILARRMIEDKKYAQAYKLIIKHGQREGLPFAQAEWLAGWLALEFLNMPWEAFEHFERVYHKVETPISKSRAAYWAGRASDKLNHKDISQKWYKVAAQTQTTFYGQLAAAAIKAPQALPVPTIKSSTKPSGQSIADMLKAAQYLSEAGMRSEASSFLLRITTVGRKPDDFLLAAQQASRSGLKHIAIRIAQDAEKQNILLPDYAYPQIENYMRGINDVEWALVHGLIRQESRFDEEAVSSAGARGLMQLMPGTAKEVARKSGLSHQNEWLTSRPAHNIKLGSKYIGQLVARYDGNYAIALAGYNAGPSRANRWIEEFGDPRKGEIDLVDWIELIPIYETRNYVQRVMEGVYVYRLRLKNIQKDHNIPIHIAYHGDEGKKN